MSTYTNFAADFVNSTMNSSTTVRMQSFIRFKQLMHEIIKENTNYNR